MHGDNEDRDRGTQPQLEESLLEEAASSTTRYPRVIADFESEDEVSIQIKGGPACKGREAGREEGGKQHGQHAQPHLERGLGQHAVFDSALPSRALADEPIHTTRTHTALLLAPAAHPQALLPPRP